MSTTATETPTVSPPAPPVPRHSSPRRPSLPVVRGVLGIVLLLAFLGTGVELFLLEHTEDTWQWAPIILIGLAVILLAWDLLSRQRSMRRPLMVLMTACAVSGVVGIVLHYRGNMEFELEMYPGLAGWALIKGTLMGATPSLAPGTMIQLGLLGLLYAWLPKRQPDRP